MRARPARARISSAARTRIAPRSYGVRARHAGNARCGRVDRALAVGGAAERHVRDDLLGRRIDDIATPAVRRVDPLPVDELTIRIRRMSTTGARSRA